MSDRLTIVVCAECGAAQNLPDVLEHPFRCKCYMSPRWQLGTWFKDADNWAPKSTQVYP